MKGQIEHFAGMLVLILVFVVFFGFILMSGFVKDKENEKILVNVMDLENQNKEKDSLNEFLKISRELGEYCNNKGILNGKLDFFYKNNIGFTVICGDEENEIIKCEKENVREFKIYNGKVKYCG